MRVADIVLYPFYSCPESLYSSHPPYPTPLLPFPFLAPLASFKRASRPFTPPPLSVYPRCRWPVPLWPARSISPYPEIRASPATKVRARSHEWPLRSAPILPFVLRFHLEVTPIPEGRQVWVSIQGGWLNDTIWVSGMGMGGGKWP